VNIAAGKMSMTSEMPKSFNQKLPASAVPIKFEYRQPNFVGPLGECRVFAHEQSIALGLLSFEVTTENPDLADAFFSPFRVYLIKRKFDEFDTSKGFRQIYRG
jgi:hypothetical protein